MMMKKTNNNNNDNININIDMIMIIIITIITNNKVRARLGRGARDVALWLRPVAVCMPGSSARLH